MWGVGIGKICIRWLRTDPSDRDPPGKKKKKTVYPVNIFASLGIRWKAPDASCVRGIDVRGGFFFFRHRDGNDHTATALGVGSA
jgi:hypothetical protein